MLQCSHEHSVRSTEQVSAYKEAFAGFDKGQLALVSSLSELIAAFTEGNGSVPAKQVGTILRSLGFIPTQSALAIYDSANRSVDFEEFLDIVSNELETGDDEGGILEAFKLLDKDGTGFISTADLKAVMMGLGG